MLKISFVTVILITLCVSIYAQDTFELTLNNFRRINLYDSNENNFKFLIKFEEIKEKSKYAIVILPSNVNFTFEFKSDNASIDGKKSTKVLVSLTNKDMELNFDILSNLEMKQDAYFDIVFQLVEEYTPINTVINDLA